MTLNIIVSEARALRSGVSTKVKDDKAGWCDNDAETGTVHLKTVCAGHKTTSGWSGFRCSSNYQIISALRSSYSRANGERCAYQVFCLVGAFPDKRVVTGWWIPE